MDFLQLPIVRRTHRVAHCEFTESRCGEQEVRKVRILLSNTRQGVEQHDEGTADRILPVRMDYWVALFLCLGWLDSLDRKPFVGRSLRPFGGRALLFTILVGENRES